MTKHVDIAKKAAAKRALEFVAPDMLIGLGTGSTAAYFIEYLAEKCRKGLSIKAVPSSYKTEELAKRLSIPLISVDKVSELDLNVDGADEVNAKKQMIKGAGGALLREKVLADISKETIIIVDDKKKVKNLGKCKLPIEIIPYAYQATIKKLQNLGLNGSLRYLDSKLFITDNHNYIYDISFDELCKDPENLDTTIQKIPGVVATGYFFNLATWVIVGYEDGHVEMIG